MSGHDLPPPPSPAKARLSAADRQARHADRLTTIRLRMAIHWTLDERGISSPAEVGAALGMSASAATTLLARHQWREGDVALLEAAAVRLGVKRLGTPDQRVVVARQGGVGKSAHIAEPHISTIGTKLSPDSVDNSDRSAFARFRPGRPSS